MNRQRAALVGACRLFFQIVSVAWVIFRARFHPPSARLLRGSMPPPANNCLTSVATQTSCRRTTTGKAAIPERPCTKKTPLLYIPYRKRVNHRRTCRGIGRPKACTSPGNQTSPAIFWWLFSAPSSRKQSSLLSSRPSENDHQLGLFVQEWL